MTPHVQVWRSGWLQLQGNLARYCVRSNCKRRLEIQRLTNATCTLLTQKVYFHGLNEPCVFWEFVYVMLFEVSLFYYQYKMAHHPGPERERERESVCVCFDLHKNKVHFKCKQVWQPIIYLDLFRFYPLLTKSISLGITIMLVEM